METKENTGMLDLIIHPAFSVRDGVVLHVNQTAVQRMITIGTPIADLITSGLEEYEQFSDGYLYLTITVANHSCGASVSRIDGEDIFILEENSDSAELNALALAAQGLRGSLSNIMSNADRLFPLLDTEDNPTAKALMAQINKNLFQMLRVISNMSDAVQYTHTAVTDQETIDICAFLDEIFQKAQEILKSTGIRLKFAGLPESIYCLANSEKLERAVYNMISNAIKFTPKDGLINAKLLRQGARLYLTIQDGGSGISPTKLGNIYTRYCREPSLEDRRFGIGLGMVLIRSAAALHGGTVLIDQPAGQGTRVTMTMAIRQRKNTLVRNCPMKVDYVGERDHALIELSETLPAELYNPNNIN